MLLPVVPLLDYVPSMFAPPPGQLMTQIPFQTKHSLVLMANHHRNTLSLEHMKTHFDKEFYNQISSKN
jgi:hypothetical protein